LAQCSRGTSPPGPRPIRVATSKNLWCALTLIADAQGYFHARGLDPQMNYQAAGRLNMDALLGGTVDFANVVETNIAYQALNRTSNLAILGRIVSATDYAILTRGSAGIQHPADLVGKRLAYAQATGAESFVFWFLEKEGISPSSLTLIPLQPAGLVDHFLGGGAEAVATWEPFVTTIRSRMASLGPTFESDGKGFAGIMTVGALRTYAEGNRSTVEAYEGAMEDAARLVSDNPDLAQNIVAEQTGIPPETVRSIWHRFDFRYEKSTSRDGALIEEVISRIQRNLPDMSAREPADVRSYYIPVQGTNP
jgi:sulfonate transport system substrate-binding protein